MAARPPRGGGGVRGGRRGRDHRRARRLRGELRPGQPAPDQRPVRRQPQPGARAGDRRAHPARRRSAAATSRRPTRRSCSASAASTASWSASPSSCRGCWRSRCARRSSSGASPSSSSPARSSWTDARGRREPARRSGPTAVASSVPSDDALGSRGRGRSTPPKRVTILAGAGCAGRPRRGRSRSPGRCRRRSCTRCAARSSSSTTTRTTSGMTGLLGFASGYRAMEHCDALLMLGTDFPYRAVLSRRRDRDRAGRHPRRADRPAHAGRRRRWSARSRTPSRRCCRGCDAERRPAHLDRHAQRTTAATRKRLDALADDDRDRGPLHPQFVAAAVDRLAADDAVFIPDVGTPVVWAARYLRMNGRRRLIGSFNHGTMANALPQAIGAQAAQPGPAGRRARPATAAWRCCSASCSPSASSGCR